MEKEFINKIVAIQNELKAPKSQYNNFGKYKYRSCEDILEAVKPLLRKYELILNITDDIINLGNRYYVKATVLLTDGTSSLENSAFAREEESKKGADGSQITGAASSYARKYALNGLFCIDDTKDSDATNQGQEAPKKVMSDDLAMALQEIKAATSKEVLMGVWNTYKNLQKEAAFVTALTNRKTELKNAA